MMKAEIDNQMARMFFACDISVTVVSHHEFRLLIQMLRPDYDPPSAEQLEEKIALVAKAVYVKGETDSLFDLAADLSEDFKDNGSALELRQDMTVILPSKDLCDDETPDAEEKEFSLTNDIDQQNQAENSSLSAEIKPEANLSLMTPKADRPACDLGAKLDCSEVLSTPSHLTRPIQAIRKRTGKKPHTSPTKDLKPSSSPKNKPLKTPSHHPCSICDKVFRNDDRLQIHLRSHSGEKPFSCPTCGKTYKHSANLQAHLQVHKGEKAHACPVCDQSFIQKRYLAKHIRTAHTPSKDKPHRCNICDKSFVHHSPLLVHMRSHTGEKPHQCSTCGERFRQSAHLMIHMLRHTGEKPCACPTCGKRFTTPTELRTHQGVHSDRKKLFHCQHCEKSFGNSHNLKVHLLTHSGEKPHACTTCDKRFVTKWKLKEHQIVHSGEKPHECPVCHKSFARSGDLKDHMLIHTEREFKCDFCEKSFARNETLSQHLRIHTGEKPYTCKTCGKNCSRISDLKRHEKVHTTGFTPHQCPNCEKSFRSESVLEAHMNIHTGEKPFVCGTCDKRFALSRQYRRHVQNNCTGVDKSYLCQTCSKEFRRLESLQKHLLAQHAGEAYTVQEITIEQNLGEEIQTEQSMADQVNNIIIERSADEKNVEITIEPSVQEEILIDADVHQIFMSE